MLNTAQAPSFADTLMAARVADHIAHCPNARAIKEASDKAVADNGASMQRRDRILLGLHIVTPRA
ncbi:hypothetical protein [Streptomyces sp. NPDC055105]|uniref:hypothetical protein n=1 Tax=Streptomyces sp. NPDC055105 TaxID=3365719 RepID=UPI0037D3F5F2